jgi:hypothetical protein
MRLAAASGLSKPTFLVDDRGLIDAVEGRGPLPDKAAFLLSELQQLAEEIPGFRLKQVSPSANRARSVALAPLVDWLPERARRSDRLHVRPIGHHQFLVESASHAGESYRVSIGDGGADGTEIDLQCECADFQYRGIPCKHLLAAARESGALDRLFYREGVSSAS